VVRGKKKHAGRQTHQVLEKLQKREIRRTARSARRPLRSTIGSLGGGAGQGGGVKSAVHLNRGNIIAEWAPGCSAMEVDKTKGESFVEEAKGCKDHAGKSALHNKGGRGLKKKGTGNCGKKNTLERHRRGCKGESEDSREHRVKKAAMGESQKVQSDVENQRGQGRKKSDPML